MKKLIRLLRRVLGPYLGIAAFSLLALAAMVVLELSIPRLIERIVDQGIREGNMRVVLHTALVMVLLSITNMAAAVLNSVSSVRVGEGVARDLREAVFAKLMGFSQGDLDGFTTGQLMVRLTSDVQAVQRVVQVSLRIGTRAPLTMLGSVVLMFITSPELALAMAPLLVLTGAGIILYSARMEPLFREVQKQLDRLNTVLQENIAGSRLVKAFVRGDRESRRFGEENEALMGKTVSVMRYSSSMGPVLTACINLGMVMVLWIGGRKAVGGSLSLGQIIAFTNYLLTTMNPLIMMSQLANTWANGIASAKRVSEVLERRPSVLDLGAAREAAITEGAIEMEGLSFGYGDGGEVLSGIDLAIPAGSTVAILGATGAGKSSLVNLIPRFYDPQRGSVRLDGVDVRELRQNSLMGSIAVVPQETILFTGSVADNIRYGVQAATEAELIQAAKAAEAHEFILRLPQGYETRVEERGVNLSGGQKQRLAIARALIIKPRILIMDDSTSAVDVETETRIQRNIATQGCTVVVVAQRISTVLSADKIVVLDQGRVAAMGRHEELMRRSPIYREIFDSQLGSGLLNRRGA